VSARGQRSLSVSIVGYVLVFSRIPVFFGARALSVGGAGGHPHDDDHDAAG